MIQRDTPKKSDFLQYDEQATLTSLKGTMCGTCCIKNCAVFFPCSNSLTKCDGFTQSLKHRPPPPLPSGPASTHQHHPHHNCYILPYFSTDAQIKRKKNLLLLSKWTLWLGCHCIRGSAVNNTLTFCVQLKHTKRQSVRLGVGVGGGSQRV